MAGNFSENPETSLMAIKYQCEVEFSRFFNFPPRCSSSSSPNLRPLPKSKYRCGGTWISSASTASLSLMTDSSNPETILTVTLAGKIVEEHFTCNLHFSWPQVSCVTQCPTRGSRVVFASYRVYDGQIQKFALRFATACDAQTFFDTLKDNLKDAREGGLPQRDFGSEIVSQSEFVSSNGLQYRAEELSLMDPVASYTPQVAPMLNYTSKQSTCSQESFFSNNFEGTCGDLPPSFTALLTNCSAEAELGKAKVSEEGNLNSQIMIPQEVDLKCQIMRYMSDSSFHDMLTKVEEVISEMGGDLAL